MSLNAFEKFVGNNLNLKWDFKILSINPSITENFLNKYPHLKWDLKWDLKY